MLLLLRGTWCCAELPERVVPLGLGPVGLGSVGLENSGGMGVRLVWFSSARATPVLGGRAPSKKIRATLRGTSLARGFV